ncbi:helix-turn-helix transcriptional regulator [Halobaculum rubrum]|uniref:helix-turn-helix transcriptional regulator n=1 Tax=Halobaculum rubrum TaxID=2872158 RepID=UPI001CA39E29|nr:helix-turn-helix transcriptional regulator [Halobaculum rubrum]QZX99292.1 helix-turn-helix transcriptional regulator [Halobaculum rubrum]
MSEDLFDDERDWDGFPEPQSVLTELASDPDVDSGVSAATVIESESELVERRVRRTLTANDPDAANRSSFPAPKYEGLVASRRGFESRYDDAPTGFTDAEVPYVEHGRPARECGRCTGSGRETCNRCNGTEKHTCRTCGGDKERTCPECDGETRKTCPECDGDAIEECPECTSGTLGCDVCDGTGTEECQNCDSTGTLTSEHQCPRCDGRSAIKCPDCDGDDDECDGCDGEVVVDCPRCDGEGVEDVERDCPECSGDGSNDCEACGGTAERDCDTCGGEGQIRCSRCHGSEEVRCTTCDETGEIRCTVCDESGNVECDVCEDGRVTCDTCEGHGELVEAHEGTLSFKTDTVVNLNATAVPTDHVTGHDGWEAERERRDPETDGGLYREETTVDEIPVTRVRYRHGGNEFVVFQIDGDVRYDDAPKPTAALREQVESAVEDGFFEYDDDRTLAETIKAGPRQFVGSVVTVGVVAGIAAVITVVGSFLLAALPLGSSITDTIGIALPVVGGVLYASRRRPSRRIATAANGAGLLAPAVGVVLAAVAVVSAVGSPLLRVVVVAAAVAFWADRVAGRLAYESVRLSHASSQRRTFIADTLDARPSELDGHAFTDRLPDPDPSPAPTFLDRVAAVAHTGGVGATAGYLGLLVVTLVVDPTLLLQYVPYSVALGGPVLVFAGVTLGLASIGFGGSASTDESSEPQPAAPSKSTDPLDDGRSDPTAVDLTERQLLLLYFVDTLDEAHGLALTDRYEEQIGTELNHGQLYPDLDTLRDAGLVNKVSAGRSDRYVTTTEGEAVLQRRHAELEGLVDAALQPPQ